MIEILITIIAMVIASKFRTAFDEKEEELIENNVSIFLEKIQNQYYAWYIEPKEEFICQADSIDNILNILAKKFENYNLNIKTTKEIECQLKELKLIKSLN